METEKITQTIVQYLAQNPKTLKGTVLNKSYFLVEGYGNPYTDSRDKNIAFGTAIDVLADMIEKKVFFSFYPGGGRGPVEYEENGRITPMKEGDTLSIHAKLKITENSAQLVVDADGIVDKVEPKGYLDALKTPQGFIQSAKVLGVEGDLEQIASELYTS